MSRIADCQAVYRVRKEFQRAHICLGTACGLLLSAGASAQDVAAFGSAELHEMMLDGPRDLPGKEPGPREVTPLPQQEATPPPQEREWFGGLPWSEWSRLTGDWWGGRAWLCDHGLTIDSSLTWDWSSVWTGGLRRVASDRILFDVNATLDLETAFGWKGASVYADAYFTDVSGGSRDVGDWQGISNIDTEENRSELAELWFQQYMLEKHLRLKIGQIDASYEFAFTETGRDFLHNSPAYSPTIQNLPVYPDPAFGVVLYAYPSEHWYAGAGVFDGALHDGHSTGNRWPDTAFSDSDSDSYFFIAETGFTWDGSGTWGKGRAAVGGHYHTGEYERFDGGEKDGSAGLCFVIEQQVWRKGDGDDDEQGLYLFGQIAFGQDSVNDVGMHLAGGCVLRGIGETRPDDSTGIYASFVDLSDAPGSPYVDNETAVEVYYQFWLTESITLTPDFQVIFTPSGDPSIDTAIVGAIRVSIAF